MAKQAENKVLSIRQSLGSLKKNFTRLNEKSGGDILWEREFFFAMQVVEANKGLQKCPLDSIKKAVFNLASIGITLNPAEKLAYLVPRDGRAVLDISYRGLVKIATDSGSIEWAKAVLVYEQDKFIHHGVDEKPTHDFEAFSKNRGELVGGFSLAKLASGGYLTDTMTIEEIYRVRDMSKAWTRIKDNKPAPSGPWKDWPEEMIKKTLLRRGSKSWPQSKRFMEAEAALNEHQGLDITPEMEEPEIVRLISDEQVKKLQAEIDAIKLDPKRIFKAFEITKLADLPADKYNDCKARLDAAKDVAEKKAAEEKKKSEDKGKDDKK